jgi:hypothetical protein
VADDIVTRLRHVVWLAEEGSEVTDLAEDAADEIMRLRAVLDAIDAQHTSFTEDGDEFCHVCVGAWPCRTHLLINPVASSSQSNLHDRPTTLDDAIDTLGAVWEAARKEEQ